MERLTEWNGGQTRHAYYPRCFKEPCYGSGCKIKDCPFETAVCERLAAYEDIGLTPEEIKAPFTENTMINLAAQALGVEPSRLRELAEADKDGRCVVLPCKVGDTVWRIVGRGTNGHRSVQQRKVLAVTIYHTGDMIIHTDGAENRFGKTAFHTREEAEAALGRDHDA